jgi:glycosyltransferase involved in cell wall biosynthesis
MKVLINAVSARMGGALTYITNILREIPQAANGDKFVVAIPQIVQKELESIIDRDVIELVPFRIDEGKFLQRIYFDNWVIPRLACDHKADVLFSSTGFGSFRSPCPEVLLVRNALFFCPMLQQRYREIGRSFHGIRMKRWMSLLSVRSADVVLFPTIAMRRLLENHTSLRRKQTKVLHYGFSRDHFFKNSDDKPDIVDKINNWKKQGYRILLNVSHYAVHKNFETVIEALHTLVVSGLKLKFVTTLFRDVLGERTDFDILIRRMRELDLSDVVISSGCLKYDQIHYLYQNADIFIFPSFTESFGHPLVEAMACGLPIVASDTPVNRELCGEAASYFDVFSPESCSQSIVEMLNNSDNCKLMCACSMRRAGDFSWSFYVISLLNILRNVCGLEEK